MNMSGNYSVDVDMCDLTSSEYVVDMIHAISFIVTTIQAVAVTFIAVTGLILSVFLACVIILEKKLHKRSFIIGLQIVFLDIGFIVLVQIPIIVTASARDWVFGSALCQMLGALSLFVSTWRWPVMFILTLDRFLSVFKPFHYTIYANKIMFSLSIIAFIASVGVSLVPLSKFGCYRFNDAALTCAISWECNNILCFLYYIFISGLVFTIGGIAPLIMYIVMYIKARKITKKFINTIVPIEEEPTSTNNFKNITSHDKRASITILILFISLIGLTTPFYLVVAVYEFCAILGINLPSIHILFYFLNNLYYALPIADAIVIMKNKYVKTVLKKILKQMQVMCVERFKPNWNTIF